MTRNNETSIFEGKEKRSRNESEKQEQNGDKIIGEEGRERRKEGEKEKNRARFSLPGGKQPERGKQACCVDERRSVPVKSDLYRTRDAFQLGLEPQVFFFFFFEHPPRYGSTTSLNSFRNRKGSRTIEIDANLPLASIGSWHARRWWIQPRVNGTDPRDWLPLTSDKFHISRSVLLPFLFARFFVTRRGLSAFDRGNWTRYYAVL